MRSVFDLVATVPEAKGTGANVVLGGGQGGAFGATLDGISVNTNRNADTTETAFLTPSVEAITEFSVETNGFKPEFGQAGGGAITFASKSGTNEFQGSRLQLPPQRRAGLRRATSRPTKGIVPAEQFRRVAGRPGSDSAPLRRQEQDVLLRRVRGLHEQPGAECHDAERPDSGNVQRRFFELGRQPGPVDRDLRSGDDAAQPQRDRVHQGSVPRQPDSRQPLQRGCEAIPRAGAVGRRAESDGAGARDVRLRVEQFPLAGRDDAGDDPQAQRESRSRAEQRASPVVSLQPRHQRNPAW